MNRIVLAFFLCYVSFSLKAQDFQYSQFYAAPLYINPAFTGLTEQHRIVANVRDQWPGLSNDFLSTSFSYDRWIDDLNSGVGLIANGELSGAGRLWRAEIAPTYAYQAVIKDLVVFRPGIKVGFNQLGINKNRLVFNDQLESGTVTAETNIRPSRFYMDFSAGFLALYENYWAGMSVSHLNEPDQSLVDNGVESRLPKKWSIQAGAKIPLEIKGNEQATNRSISLVMHYKAQGKFDQLDIGGYINTNPVVWGIWYRGLPLKSNKKGHLNADAITLLMGIKKENYSIGFSYDVTISKLAVTSSAGSFEMSFIREWTHKKKKRRKHFIIPCAKF